MEKIAYHSKSLEVGGLFEGKSPFDFCYNNSFSLNLFYFLLLSSLDEGVLLCAMFV